ncbi:MAG TPA: ABC transporter substrate-binding protein [Burkholderiales bacterium]|nr:ABC transporter substrate-binding protein [Burkholderiales bacterium]
MKKPLLALALVVISAVAIPSLAADKVKIGFISTLSGPSAALGVDIRDAFMLAVKLNGGKLGGLPAEVLIGDDQFKPDVGRQLAEKDVKLDKVNFLTGFVFSNIMLASVPVAFENKVIYVSPNAAPSPLAGKQCNPYFFVASWPNDAYHEAAGQHATDKGYKSVYMIAPNYQAGKDSLEGFKRFYKGRVVGEVYTQLGQLDYSAELAQVRAAGPEAMYIFLPGGMGINFIKQFVAAGLSKDIQLITPGFSSDQDIIRAVGDPMLGTFDAAHWALDLDNAANRKFVAAFEQEYRRLPTVYASQGYDTALLIDSAVRGVKGRIEDTEGVRKALKAAKFQSVRGSFKFNRNQYPIQNYYLRVVGKDAQGRLVNKTIGTIFKDRGDAYVQDCPMR